MATRSKRLRPILRAQKRRSVMPAYFDLSGKGLFLLVVLAASLLALLALAQTGRVVATGARLRGLQEREEELLWEQEALLGEIAKAADPAELEQWALDNDMEPLSPGDLIFLPVPTILEAGAPVPMVQREP